MTPRLMSPARGQIDQLRTPLSEGERAVLNLLDAKLDQDWEIYIQPHLNGCRPDFVLLNPRIGIGVLEIKDWNLEGVSYRPGPRGRLVGKTPTREFTTEDPLEQVRRYKNEIFEIYCPRLKAPSGLAAICAGVVFPLASQRKLDALFGNRLASDYEFVAGQEALAADDIARIFPPAALRRSSLMKPELAADLRSWLIEPDHAQEQREPLALDARQRELATTRTATGYRRIRGPAGSGKTVVLAARAANLIHEKKDVLVVSFNITLRNYLRDMCARANTGKPNFATWLNFHELCRRLAYEWGVAEQYGRIWREHHDQPRGSMGFYAVPQMLLDHAAEADVVPMYDAILVDEGQDFDPSWWQLLRHLVRPGGEMLLAADRTQDVYETARRWTDGAMEKAGFRGDWNELPVSYRLPSELLRLAARFATDFLPDDMRSIPIAPERQLGLSLEPCELRWVQCSAAMSTATSIIEALAIVTAIKDSSNAVTDLTILVESVAEGMRICEALNQHKIRVAHTFADADPSNPNKWGEDRRRKLAFWKGAARVKVTTLHSFKGWEARTLVLSITHASKPTDLAVIFTGLTRLKRHAAGSTMTVVCSDERLKTFGMKWPHFENL